MYGCLNALMTFPSTYEDLMGDALSHVKWKEGGEATRATRQRLNERKREVRRRAGVEQESAYCQVEWDGVSSVTGNSEDEITSHLCSTSLPPSHILSQKLTDASERRQIERSQSLPHFTLPAIAAHQQRGGIMKRSRLRRCHPLTDGWQTASLLLTHVC